MRCHKQACSQSTNVHRSMHEQTNKNERMRGRASVAQTPQHLGLPKLAIQRASSILSDTSNELNDSATLACSEKSPKSNIKRHSMHVQS